MQKAQKLNFLSWIDSFRFGKVAAKKLTTGYVYFIGSDDAKMFNSLVREHSLAWQVTALKKNDREMVYFPGKKGPVWILRPKASGRGAGHEGRLDESAYAFCRDQFGTLVSHFKAQQLKQVQLDFHGTSEAQELGAFVGLELAAYNYRAVVEDRQLQDLPAVSFKKSLGVVNKEIMREANLRARAVNLARHLVNLPPNELNPKTFADIASKQLNFPSTMKVEIWNAARLEKEKMGLHASVGQGAEHGPCMVHLSYRPKAGAATTKKTSGKSTLKAADKNSAASTLSTPSISSAKPIAFVGKGITFDTGGLDIKPSSGMRLMKKDMGGAASVLATAMWVAESNYGRACDFYLALAENAIDAKSFRPSDVFTARNGMKVEIDNTDAEGRLVLADCLDVAVTQKGNDDPELVIDVATLTGAIKVGLGAEIAGLFSNDDELAQQLTQAGQQAGDLNWRMPLFEKYFGSMSSNFADCRNSGEGFGGAITAALFLQKFVRGKKWAHLDVYAWADKPNGAILSSGGSGQPVQCLINFLEAKR